MIGTFIRRPVFTTMFVLLLVVFGIKSYPNLGVDLYPDVELPLVSVSVTYTGASPEEMETLITRPRQSGCRYQDFVVDSSRRLFADGTGV